MYITEEVLHGVRVRRLYMGDEIVDTITEEQYKLDIESPTTRAQALKALGWE